MSRVRHGPLYNIIPGLSYLSDGHSTRSLNINNTISNIRDLCWYQHQSCASRYSCSGPNLAVRQSLYQTAIINNNTISGGHANITGWHQSTSLPGPDTSIPSHVVFSDSCFHFLAITFNLQYFKPILYSICWTTE